MGPAHPAYVGLGLAKDLIAARQTPRAVLSAEAVFELRVLCEHNDSTRSPALKVGRDDALKMLHGLGFEGSRQVLDRVCREQLGRKSWAQK